MDNSVICSSRDNCTDFNWDIAVSEDEMGNNGSLWTRNLMV